MYTVETVLFRHSIANDMYGIHSVYLPVTFIHDIPNRNPILSIEGEIWNISGGL